MTITETDPVISFFEGEAARKLNDAEGVKNAASAEGRGLTDDERARVTGLIAEAKSHKDRVADLKANKEIADAIDGMRGPINEPAEQADGGAKSLGDAFVKSSGYSTLTDGLKSGRITGKWTTGAVELPEFKATVTEAASPVAQSELLGGIRQAAAVALRQLTVADLMMQGTTDSTSVKYLLETTNTNAAAAVTEGDAKPESTITFTEVTEPVRKVATFLPVSDEMLEDVAQIRSYLDSRLALFVLHEEEDQLLNGDGTAPNVSGLLDRTGLQTGTRSALGVLTGETAGSTTIGNAVAKAIELIQTNALVEPDAIVMHPTNWLAFRVAKDGNGQYYGGGPFYGPYGNGAVDMTPNPWGLRLVVTSRIAANTALVGAFGTMAQVFYRNGLTVEASNSHSDFFQKNLTAIRAERRLALAVYRPSAFCSITALQTP